MVWIIVLVIGLAIFALTMVPLLVCRGFGRPKFGIIAVFGVIVLVTIDYFWNWSSIKYPHMTFAALTEMAPLSIFAMGAALACGIYLADR